MSLSGVRVVKHLIVARLLERDCAGGVEDVEPKELIEALMPPVLRSEGVLPKESGSGLVVLKALLESSVLRNGHRSLPLAFD